MSFTFLMCSERSGSNLVTKLFDAHPDICGPSTKHLINPVARNLFRYEDLSAPKNWRALVKDIHRLIATDFSVWKKKFTIEELLSIEPSGDITTLIRYIFESEAAEHNKPHLFIKENHLYEFLAFILINFPNSKFIYQTRDPRDMALSWRNNKSHSGGIITGAKQWSYDQKQFLRDYHLLRGLNKAFLIKYEDLIRTPENTLDAALSFLGFNYQVSMLNFHKNKTTRLNSKMQDSWSNLSQPILSDNSANFIKGLTPYETSIIEKICYYEMIALNYNPVHSKEELDKIPVEAITELEQQEKVNFPAQPTPATLNNIEAKRHFYQHEYLY